MHRRRSFRLAAAAAFALLLIPGSVGATTGRVTSAGPAANNAGSSAAAAAIFGLNGGKLKPDKTGTRGTVNATAVARKGPTKRAHATLPPLGRGPASGKPSVGQEPLVYSGTLPTQATLNADPAAKRTGFDGLQRSSGPATNVEPPDPWVAVGPDHIVQAVNLQMRMTDRNGNGAIDVPLADFFQLPDDTFFNSDPHVIYDSVHGRWLASEVSWDCFAGGSATFGTGYLDVGVSQTSDPTGAWDTFYLFWDDKLPDYPAPGTSSDKIGFGFNMYDMSGPGMSTSDCLDDATFDAAHFDIMDWAGVINGGDFNVLGGDIMTGFTPRFALQTPATSTKLHMIFQGDDFGLNYVSWIGTAAGVSPTLDAELVADLTAANVVAPFADPPSPNQPGPDVVTTAIDSRPTDAIWQNNRLIIPSTYPCTPTGDGTVRDCVRVTELNTAGVNTTTSPTLKQDFLIAENGKDSWMGGVGLSGDGTLNVGWTRSSTTAGDFPSSYSAHQKISAALNSVSARELLAAGTAVYTGNRWGDYLGVAQDPLVPSQVYDGNEYSGGTTEWKTKITPLRTQATTYVPITPIRVLDSRGGAGPTGAFTANVAKTWPVTGVGVIPAGAVAVTGNVTVTGQQAGGYVAITPTATNTPPASSINFPLGDTRANNVVVALASNGTLSGVYKAATGKKTHVLFDVTGYFLASDTAPDITTFTPITPVRALDTRASTALISSMPLTLPVAGHNGIPAEATAITGNLTVVGQSAGGYLSLTPTPTATPPNSTMNFPIGDVRANGVFAPLDEATGNISIVYKASTGAHTHALLDITGYFVPGTGGLHFVPMNPARVMDTRGTGIGLTGVFVSKTPRELPLDGHWGVPVLAPAVSGNLTVVSQTGGGYVSVTPDEPPPTGPPTSTINFPVGDVRANGLVTPLNGTGDTWLTYMAGNGKTTHLLLDLSGYFE